MASLFEQNGGQPQKQPKWVPIFQDRIFTGLFTQRNVLHDPSDIYTTKFYGGRPDALWQGANVELTNRLTLQRRPGLSVFSTATYPTAPNRTFSFSLSNGTIQVIVDTGSTTSLVVSAVSAPVAGTNVVTMTGTFPAGGSNAYAGMMFAVAGFASGTNNGTFLIINSTTTTMTFLNASGVVESHAATALSTGAVYVDNQDGTKTLLFGKAALAGQTHFVAVGGNLYMGDGVDTRKYTPGNTNGTVWNWGIVAPSAAPTVITTGSAANAVVWQAVSTYTTMGLLDDGTGIQQLIDVNNDGTNPSSRYGTSSNGQPTWSQATGATTADGSVTWTNQGPITLWTPKTSYAAGAPIYDPGTKCIFIMTHNFAATSGGTPPAWNPALVNTGARTSEFNAGGSTAARWGSLGQLNGNPTLVKSWKASTAFNTYIQPSSGSDPNALNCAIIEPTLALPPVPGGQPIYLQGATTGGTTGSGSNPPTWQNPRVVTQTTNDGQLGWVTVSASKTWAASHQYASWVSGSQNFGVIVDANGNLQVATSLALIGTSATIVPGTVTTTLTSVDNASGGNTTYHGTSLPIYPIGSPVVISVFAQSANKGTFNVVSSTATVLVLSNASGVSETHAGTITYNAWGTLYGQTTIDNTVTWTCIGDAVTWTANTLWYLPLTGFAPPSTSQPYGGSAVVDTNGNIQYVTSSGLSQTPGPPAWDATVGNNTVDGTIDSWYNNGLAPTQSLAWKVGYVYAISFKARALDDFYSVLDPVTGVRATPPGWPGPLAYPPTGSQTEAVSSASPFLTIVGGNTGAVNNLTGLGSTDPQVDTIIIWRSADGGGSGQMFELTEIDAPKVNANGTAGTWHFADFLPDVASALYPGLNTLIPAPINHVNDPPFSSFLPMVFNFQRIWGADGSEVPYSGGQDTKVGNPNEAYPPAYALPFLAPVIRLVKTPQGIVTFLTDSIEVIGGGPSAITFFSVTWAPGIGLQSYNALDLLAGEMYFFSADKQFRIMSPGLNVSNAGFALGDQFANQPSSGVSDTTWDPSKVYVASHQNGTDNCVIVSDGSTGWYRLNPHQAGANPNTEPVWSPFAKITNGCKMVQSIETSPGIKKLLVGAAGSAVSASILYRDQTVFTDNTTQYDAWFTMGSITLAHPGQLALLKFLEFDFSGVNYKPTISYLLNELSGSFTPFTMNPVFDPPSLYGTTITPATYSPNRYYFMGNASLARCRHMQIKVDFGTTAVGDEIYNLTIFGRIMIET